MAKKEATSAREQRLRDICSAINKGTFGGDNHDAVTYLGSRESSGIERFASGSPKLDEALGGGWPKGRFIEIFGPESGGKCVTADTYVYGHHGLVTFAEMFRELGREATCTTRVEECVYGLSGEHGMEATTHLTWNNRRPVRRIVTSGGLELCGTLNHPIRIVSQNGAVGWKKMQHVKVGDAVLTVRGMMVDPTPRGYDEDDATLLALVVAEGHVTPNRIGFTNANEGMLETFEEMVSKKFGFVNVRKYSRKNPKTGVTTWEYHCNSKQLVSDFMARYGEGCSGNSEEKSVPYCIRTSPLSVQIEFLRYYFMSEGSVDKTRSRIEMTSKSRTLIRQVQMMAMNLGVWGRVAKKTVDGVTYWRMIIDGKDAIEWQRLVSVSTLYPEKTVVAETSHGRTVYGGARFVKEILDDCADADRELWRIFDGAVGGKCDITEAVWSRFAAVRANYRFGPWAKAVMAYVDEYFRQGWDVDIVSAVDDIGTVPTFDVVKPDHTFWSNGLVSHNTTLVLHAIAEYQKKYPDEDIALIDSEYSFDEEYAAKLGVQTKFLVVHQPSSGTQALNVMRQLIQNGVKCIVVDSVAALTTQAEMEGDLGDQQVADQARMMSRALRTLTTEAGSRKVTIFFTNQVREKIGVMYGDRTTTPAGRALKHYASIRVQVSKMGTVKDKVDGEDVVVSVKTKADVKKNKTAAPFMRAEFCISFGHGIDTVAEIADTAIELKVIEKRGAWFIFKPTSEQLAQGRMAVLEMLRSDPEWLKKVSEAVEAAKVVSPNEETQDGGFMKKRASFSKRVPKDEAGEPGEAGDAGEPDENESPEAAEVQDA